MTPPDAQLAITIDGPFDLRATIGHLRIGGGDPTARFEASGWWWAIRTPDGTATIRIVASESGRFDVAAWGLGAKWAVERVPALLGVGDCADVPTGHHAVIDSLARRCRGLRLPRTGRIFELVVPIVLQQLVRWPDAAAAWRRLVSRYGEPAPGPLDRLRVAPAPKTLRRLPSYAFTQAGVLGRQAETLREVAWRASRLEEAATMSADDAERRLRAIRGIGPWTANTAMLCGMGHADAVPIGDVHLPHVVAKVLTGDPRGDDARMLELLEPYRGQRGRVIRWIQFAQPATHHPQPGRPLRTRPG